MSNYLNYTITLTGYATQEFKDLKTELEKLRELVGSGVDFPIRLSGATVQGLQKQVRDAIREGMRVQDINNGGGAQTRTGDVVSMDAEMKTQLTNLAAKVQGLVTALEASSKFPPKDTTPPTGKTHSAVDRAVKNLDTFSGIEADIQKGMDEVRRFQRGSVSMVEGIMSQMKRAFGSQYAELNQDLDRLINNVVGRISKAPGTTASIARQQNDINDLLIKLHSILQTASNKASEVLVKRAERGYRDHDPLSHGGLELKLSQSELTTLGTAIGKSMAASMGDALQGLTKERNGGGAGDSNILIRDTPVSPTEAAGYTLQAAGNDYMKLDKQRARLEKRILEAGRARNKRLKEKLTRELNDVLDDMTNMEMNLGAEAVGTPPQSSRAQANLADAFVDPASIRAKTAAHGQRWFAKLKQRQQVSVNAVAEEGFVAVPGIKQDDVRRLVNQLLANAPVGIFNKEENPNAAKYRFERRLRIEQDALDRAIKDKRLPATADQSGQGSLAALPTEAANALVRLLNRQDQLEKNKGRTADEDAELRQLRAYINELPVVSELGRTTHARYQAVSGARNFANTHLSGGARGRFLPFSLNTHEDTDIGISPLTLKEMRNNSMYSVSELGALEERMGRWQQHQGLTWWTQGQNREKALLRWLDKADKVKTSLSKGFLPEDTEAVLLNYNELMPQDKGITSDPAIMRLWDRLKQEKQSPTDRKIDPKAYADVIEAWETRHRLARREILSGGQWGKPTDEFIQRHGALVNGVPMLVTGPEAEERRMMAGDSIGSLTGILSAARAWRKNGNMRDYTHGGDVPPNGGDGFSAAMVPSGGKAVPVFIVGANPGIFGARSPKERETPALSPIQDAKLYQQQLSAQLRVEGDRQRNNEKLNYKQRSADLDLELAAKKARAEDIKLLVRTDPSKFGQLDVRSPFGVSPEQYAADPSLLTQHVKRLVGAIRSSEARVMTRELALASAVDPDMQAAERRKLDAATQNKVFTQLQLAGLLQASGGLPSMGSEALATYINTGRQYAGGRSGLGFLLNLEQQQGGLAQRKLQLETLLGSSKPLMEELYSAQSAEKAYQASQDAAQKADLAKQRLDRLQNQFAAIPSPDQMAARLEGAGTLKAASKVVADALGIVALKGEVKPGARSTSAYGVEEIGPAIAVKGEVVSEGFRGPGFSADKAIAYVEAVKQAIAAQIELETKTVRTAEERAKKAREAVPEVGMPGASEKRRDQLFAALNVNSLAEAEKVIRGLRKELGTVNGQLSQLDTKSQETLKRMAELLGTDIKNVQELTGAVEKLSQEFAKGGNSMVDAAGSFAGASGGGDGELGNFRVGMLRKVLSLSQYTMAGGVVYTFANVLRQTIRSVVDFEADLTRIRGVLETRSELAATQLGSSVISSAREYGVSVAEPLRAARVFAQIGASAPEITRLTQAAVVAQQGAGLEPQQASEMLIATRNITNGRVSPEDINDRIARIEARYAVSAQDLAEGIQRVGSLATQLQSRQLGGVDALDTVIGAVTTIVERTRVSGNQAATALRFMISRLTAPEVARDLQERYQIPLAGSNPNEMRPLMDILGSISRRYNELQNSGQSVQATELLTTFAGARQANVAAALMTDFDKVMEAATESSLAFGDAQERAKLQVDTMQGRQAQLAASFFDLTNTVLDSSGVFTAFKKSMQFLSFAMGGTADALEGGGAGSAVATAGMVAGGALLAANRATIAKWTVQRALTAEGAATSLGVSATGGLTGLLGTLGTVTAALAAFGAIVKLNEGLLYNFGWGIGRDPLRVRSEVSPELRKQFSMRADEVAERYNLSGTELLRNTQTAFDQAVARFGSDRLGRLTGNEVQGEERRKEARAFERELRSAFNQVIPAFAQISNDAEALSQAFELLRVTTMGLSMENDERTRSARESRDNILASLNKNSMLNLAGRDFEYYSPKIPQPKAIRSIGDLFGTHYEFNSKMFLDQMFQYGLMGGNMLPEFAQMQFEYGTGRMTVEQRMQELQRLNPNMGQEQAITQSMRELVEVPSDLRAAYSKAYIDLGQMEIRNQLDEGRRPSLSEVQPGIEELLRNVNSQLAKNTPAGQPPRQLTAEESLSLRRYDELTRTLGLNFVRRSKADEDFETSDLTSTFASVTNKYTKAMEDAINRQITLMQRIGEPEEVARLRATMVTFQRDDVRDATMANIRELSGDYINMRQRYLTPFINMARRQSDINTGLMLQERGFQYDDLTARLSSARSFVEELGQIRPQMMGENMQSILSLASQARAATPAALVAELGNERIDPTIRAMMNAAPAAMGSISQEQLTEQRSRINLQLAMMKRVESNFKDLFATVPGLADDMGNIVRRMTDALAVADTRGFATDATRIGTWALNLITIMSDYNAVMNSAADKAQQINREAVARSQRLLAAEQTALAVRLAADRENQQAQLVAQGNAGQVTRLGQPAQAPGYMIAALQSQAARWLQIFNAEVTRQSTILTESGSLPGTDEYKVRMSELTQSARASYFTEINNIAKQIEAITAAEDQRVKNLEVTSQRQTALRRRQTSDFDVNLAQEQAVRTAELQAQRQGGAFMRRGAPDQASLVSLGVLAAREAQIEQIFRQAYNTAAVTAADGGPIPGEPGSADRAAYDERVAALREEARRQRDSALQGVRQQRDTMLENENERRKNDRQQQVNSIASSITDPLKNVLGDYRKLTDGGDKYLVESLAGSMQQLFANRFVDSIFGESGLLGNKLRDAFDNGAFLLHEHLLLTFRTGAEILGASISQATTSGTAAVGGAAGGVRLPIGMRATGTNLFSGGRNPYLLPSESYEPSLNLGGRKSDLDRDVLNKWLGQFSGSERNEMLRAADFIASWESFRGRAYDDGTGTQTIGFGTTRINGKRITPGMTISRARATQLMLDDMKSRADSLERMDVPVNAATLSWSYNHSPGQLNLKKNQAFKEALQAENWEAVIGMLPEYNRAGGRTMAGLTNRRNAEIDYIRDFLMPRRYGSGFGATMRTYPGAGRGTQLFAGSSPYINIPSGVATPGPGIDPTFPLPRGRTLIDLMRIQQTELGQADPSVFSADSTKPRYLSADHFTPEQQALLRQRGVRSMQNLYYNSSGILIYDPTRKTGSRRVGSHFPYAISALQAGETFDDLERRARATEYPLTPSPRGERTLETLDPVSRRTMGRLLEVARERGLRARVAETTRPPENNMNYFRAGTSWTLTSRHALSAAMDLTTDSDYEAIRRIAETDPEFAGKFNPVIPGDLVHFELRTDEILGNNATQRRQAQEAIDRLRNAPSPFDNLAINGRLMDWVMFTDEAALNRRESTVDGSSLMALLGFDPRGMMLSGAVQRDTGTNLFRGGRNPYLLPQISLDTLPRIDSLPSRAVPPSSTALPPVAVPPTPATPANPTALEFIRRMQDPAALAASYQAMADRDASLAAQQRRSGAAAPATTTTTTTTTPAPGQIDNSAIWDRSRLNPRNFGLRLPEPRSSGFDLFNWAYPQYPQAPTVPPVMVETPTRPADPPFNELTAAERETRLRLGITTSLTNLALPNPYASAVVPPAPTLTFTTPQSQEVQARANSIIVAEQLRQLEQDYLAKQKKAQRYNALMSGAQMVGSLGGAAIGGSKTYAPEYASLGTSAGSLIAGALSMTGWGAIAMPIIGGLLGGLWGSSKKKDQPDPQIAPLERIERNTASQVTLLENQTKLLTLDNRFLNVAAGFTVPAYRPMTASPGAGAVIAPGAITIEVNAAPGMDAGVVADHVAAALRRELSGRGTGFDLRTM